MPIREDLVRVLQIKHPTNSSSTSSGCDDGNSRWSQRLCSRFKLESVLPCVSWMSSYRVHEYLRDDILAGITIGTMLIPQAMSYAKLAGLPPICGLYAGFVPNLAYGVFGSSRQVANGPVALVSLLVYNVLSGMVPPEAENYTQQYVALAVLLALMVGLLECTMGILRLGWLVRFISHSVTSGFTSASAIIIGLSQAKYFLGYSISRSTKIVPLLWSIMQGYKEFQPIPFLMGCLMLSILLSMKHVGKTIKRFRSVRAAGPLTAVIIGTVFVKLFRPPSISVIGEIPQGLPQFSLDYDFKDAKGLLSTAFVITGVAILESVAIAKTLAAKNGYEIDSNQELFGLGVANILGSLFQSYPTTGSFSRSAVNHDAGAHTGLSGIVTGFMIGCVLLFLTPLFSDIPQCALAAIVVSAVAGLVDYDEAIFLWRVKKKDFCLWVAAFANTLFFGVEIGVLIAITLSLVFVIYESANPHIAILGRLPGTTVYRNVRQYADAYTYHGIVIVRIDAPMYFANISFIKDRLRKYELCSKGTASRGLRTEDIRFVIIEMSPVTYVDSTAIHAIKELYLEYKSRNIQMALSNPNEQVMKTLDRAGIPELIGLEWYFVRVHDAVQVCLSRLQKENYPRPDGDESAPLVIVQRRGD
ncbi:hypothetical protein SELMODRAFT_90185 [Selaginella moellendorffii]|uniref:STAS domain-containing protein n=1 Tax=Selaginella moellendorffii TaxID=88036 RepID=D8RD26_SELML|nr:sulfate transporter 4.1, chloroplastic [Selaginella moellendorffii]EFJ29944.1 hypothetical protein SELMODRAFT_90185 [Selaginella moellendorffii]|eukprot:XP_002968828.1 sulfate transporter 4.1, chloroplastic [Selaginella moellendorffii]